MWQRFLHLTLSDNPYEEKRGSVICKAGAENLGHTSGKLYPQSCITSIYRVQIITPMPSTSLLYESKFFRDPRELLSERSLRSVRQSAQVISACVQRNQPMYESGMQEGCGVFWGNTHMNQPERAVLEGHVAPFKYSLI